jgi:hypothetical protein
MNDLKLSATAISIDPESVKQLIDQAVQNSIMTAVEDMIEDPVWLEKIENLVKQSMVQRVVAGLSGIDVNNVIRQRVDENMNDSNSKIVRRLQTPGIQDHAQQSELTVLDENVVVENCLTADRI